MSPSSRRSQHHRERSALREESFHPCGEKHIISRRPIAVIEVYQRL
jgi:hypothetical protein